MSTKNLLVELFVEELPPKALKKLGQEFAGVVFETLKSQGLLEERSEYVDYASPRRLAVWISFVAPQAQDKPISQKLMPSTIGLDANGKATPALLKRLEALGADSSSVSGLRKENDGKTEILFLDVIQTGATLKDALQKAIEVSISRLPIPKVMTYQINDGWENVNFVRPAHGLVALYGEEVVPIKILGLQSGKTTKGHRFEAKVNLINLTDADSYEFQLKNEGAVIANFEQRRNEIIQQLNVAASKEGLTPIEDKDLLDEVTALVERPNVLLGQFEELYLEVPQECLILTMKANQKYFPLLDSNNKLTNKFLIVSNISPADPSAVIGGNERVVRPRLADAKFFFDQDKKKTLESRLPGLYKVVYHNLLGTQGERNERVCAIARDIGKSLLNEDVYYGDSLSGQAAHAAKLSKADLLTDMVGEFPELQGIMGGYYAKHDGLSVEIAEAIEDHYKPRFSGDELPRNQVGVVVALADKLETLVGLFGINQIPTGDKDQFGLRRHTLGILRLLDEKQLKIDLLSLLNIACHQFEKLGNFKRNDGAVIDFIYERAISLFTELGYSRNEVEAVLIIDHLNIYTIKKRLEAVRAFINLSEAPALAAANKRVGNILKKIEGEIQSEVRNSLLQEPAEIALNQALTKVRPEADRAFENGDYTASLQALAALKTPVDAFFDGVMVNAEDNDLRTNRLALLSQLHQAMNRIADLSKLAS